jgi:hypothetical protein
MPTTPFAGLIDAVVHMHLTPWRYKDIQPAYGSEARGSVLAEVYTN